MTQPQLRNVSIIAHVDHGKTTLVDELLRQSGLLQVSGEREDRVLDSMDIERERGITILAKTTSITYGGIKINIVDTPGHADFGGEVERSLAMVDGVILLVDAAEGPLPQTRFVLEKALLKELRVIVVLNKLDRDDARPAEVLDEVYDLFIDLDANEEQLDFPVIYAIGREGKATLSLDQPMGDLRVLMDAILERIPPPKIPRHGKTQFLVAMLDYDEYVGRLALGRIESGKLVRGARYSLCAEDETTMVKLSQLYTFQGLERSSASQAQPGDIVAIAGIPELSIGDTVADADDPTPCPRITVDEPTVSIGIGINDGPFSGQSGNRLTSRQIRDRLYREALHNVSIRVAPTEGGDGYQVFGRGELQLGILIEMMRREGFEMTVSRPAVLLKDLNGEKLEPFERLTLDLPEEYVGLATTRLARRLGKMIDMGNKGVGRVRMVFRVPARGLIGFRGDFLGQTRGKAVINTNFDAFDSCLGDVPRRTNGSLVADRGGRVTGHAVEGLQQRGVLFVRPGDQVYEGMVVGEHNRGNDLNVNIVRERKLTNVRAASADEALVLDAARVMSLEEAVAWIDDDELVEITPDHVRLRKRVLAANRRSVKRR